MMEADESRARMEQRHKSFSMESHSGYCATAFGDHNVITSTKEARSYPDIQAEDIIMEDTNIKFQSDKENQTDICEVIQENASPRQKLKQREDELRKHKWDHRKIRHNDAATKFYTGLPAFALFLWLFNFLRPKAERMSYWTGSKINEERSRFRTSALSLIDQMFSVLMRIRLGITPSGVISFVSEGWGGRVSDRALTMESGFIDLLDENDSVMADKGFTIY
ncbi:hypothetical protein FSP39_011439 [Pinctada imbricata]|uniref:DDE Tnp4 domain-containing protein n=1 Tax=Pinctada imbricata TaxID=66713 RepID=A0AA89C0I4_PINIB|nr:hypothetical protein FSP39_011439 [Pinctada imbricata]